MGRLPSFQPSPLPPPPTLPATQVRFYRQSGPDSLGPDAELERRDEVIISVLRGSLGGVWGAGQRHMLSQGPSSPSAWH